MTIKADTWLSDEWLSRQWPILLAWFGFLAGFVLGRMMR